MIIWWFKAIMIDNPLCRSLTESSRNCAKQFWHISQNLLCQSFPRGKVYPYQNPMWCELTKMKRKRLDIRAYVRASRHYLFTEKKCLEMISRSMGNCKILIFSAHFVRKNHKMHDTLFASSIRTYAIFMFFLPSRFSRLVFCTSKKVFRMPKHFPKLDDNEERGAAGSMQLPGFSSADTQARAFHPIGRTFANGMNYHRPAFIHVALRLLAFHYLAKGTLCDCRTKFLLYRHKTE